MTTKVLIYPEFPEVDEGNGGVGRVVAMQKKHLPSLGITLVDRVEDADIVACHITIPNDWLKLYPEKKFVAHCHGLYWDDYTWLRWTTTANVEVMEAIRVADAVTSPSEWVSQTIRRATARRVQTIYHGIDADEWSAPRPEGLGRYVLFDKTRVDPVCEIDSLTAVAAMLPDVSFVSTAGTFTAPNIAAPGKQPYEAAAALTRGAWIYLATTRETFGMSIVQAMAAGVPVVGYAWGGQSEICGHAALLVTPGDHRALADAIARVWSDDKLHERMATAARSRAAEPDLDARTVCEQYATLYESLLVPRDKRVSVIIPAYNLAKYLPDAIESVLAQMGHADELIIVDDNSPDNCGEIADAFAESDSRVKVIHNEANLYLSGARNAGIAVSRGRYILPLDADDMIAPGTIDVLAAQLDRNRHYHIAYGGVQFREEDGVTLSRYESYPPGKSGWPIQFRQEWQSNEKNLLPYASMYRREVWECLGGYRSHNRTAEDADFWTRASRYGFRPHMATQEPTLIYRNRPGSMSRAVPQYHWGKWFSPRLPAGASTDEQLPVPVLAPPVISVIIPVGEGHQKYMETALDSLEAQTFLNWDCVVVDDTLTGLPPMPSWAVQMKGDQLGPAVARNLGAAWSAGRLIVPLDADDYLQPDALQAFYDAYQATAPETRKRTVFYSDWWEDAKEPGVYTRYSPADYDARLLTSKGALHAVTTCYHRDVFNEVGGYPDVPGWEDWAFQLACAEAGICSRRIAAPLFTYRKWTGQRRESNNAAFEEGKAAILARFGRYWEGEQLMACGCQSGKSSTFTPEGAVQSYGDPNRSQDAQLVQYVGNEEADIPVRGPSGVLYTFAKGDVKWVLNEDVAKLLADRTFQRANVAPEIQTSAESDQPVLAAVGL